MQKSIIRYIKSIAVVFSAAMFFSCTNSVKEVNDFLADKNLPIGEAFDINHIHTDSGRVDVKMKTPLMLDFKNREDHPYNEFPEGLEITTFEKNGDSTTIMGNFARSYTKTSVSEMIGDVVVINHAMDHKLTTDQIYWDQISGYFFTERNFIFYTKTDTIYGRGFEATQDLQRWWVKNQSGVIELSE